MPMAPHSTVYERLGGEHALVAAVGLLHQRILQDPVLAPFFAGVDMGTLQAKFVGFLSRVFGGPTSLYGRDLRASHAHLVASGGLSHGHFDAVVSHLKDTLKDLDVDAVCIEEVLFAVESTRQAVLGLAE